MSDNEFYNIYVAKQKEMINELVNRCMLAESKVSLYEAQIVKIKEEKESIQKDLEECRSQLPPTHVHKSK